MSDLKAIQFQVSSGTVVTAQGLKFAEIMAVKREGIGFKMQAPQIQFQSLVFDIFQYERQASNPIIPDAGISFAKTGGSGLAPRTEFFRVGDIVKPGYKYKLSNLNFGVNIQYTSNDIDTQQSVMDALITLTNSSGFGYGATGIIVGSTKYIRITMGVIALSLTATLEQAFTTKYQRGLFVTIHGKDYLIADTVSYDFFLPNPPITNPIDFNNLTLLPNGIQAYAYNDQYATLYYSTFVVGTSTVTNVPVVVMGGLPDDGSSVVINDIDNTLTFQDGFNNETLTILHR